MPNLTSPSQFFRRGNINFTQTDPTFLNRHITHIVNSELLLFLRTLWTPTSAVADVIRGGFPNMPRPTAPLHGRPRVDIDLGQTLPAANKCLRAEDCERQPGSRAAAAREAGWARVRGRRRRGSCYDVAMRADVAHGTCRAPTGGGARERRTESR